MDEKLEISEPAQYKALGHPLRHRILFALGGEASTISRLARALDQRKGTIAHHLGVLQEAGLVHIAETRTVRGGTEHRYLRSARRFIFSGPESDPIAMRAVADEMAAAEDVLGFRIRNVRLTGEQARAIAATLEELVDGIDEEQADRHTVVVTVYRPASGRAVEEGQPH
ncbi:ArsR/SmtB family transcription factor [Actinoplanes sp. HUAS TT8]|uniref:ArsR/SmtB family transcription factor n=1 Tax=Actinoplanes sp. HUAS TT8 TaxID=3447453 RepID=UPI003F51D958